MTEPRRLLAGDATEFERLLLGAASREQPTHLQRKRMRRALVFAELGFLTTATKALAGWTNHVVVVAVVAASVVGGASSSTPTLRGNEHTAPRVERESTRVLTQAESSAVLTPPSFDAAAEHLPLVQESPPDTKAGTRVRADGAPRRTLDLREEIALMDRARIALRSGAPADALSTLERYRTRFPRGSFGQEASVLRVEALAATGSRNRAVAEARAFLTARPNSPHAERLRHVIAGGSSPRR